MGKAEIALGTGQPLSRIYNFHLISVACWKCPTSLVIDSKLTPQNGNRGQRVTTASLTQVSSFKKSSKASQQLIFKRDVDGCVMAVRDPQPPKVPPGRGCLTLTEAQICKITSHRDLEIKEVRRIWGPPKLCSLHYIQLFPLRWYPLALMGHRITITTHISFYYTFRHASNNRRVYWPWRPHPQGCVRSPFPLRTLPNPINWIRTPTPMGLIGWWLGWLYQTEPGRLESLLSPPFPSTLRRMTSMHQ